MNCRTLFSFIFLIVSLVPALSSSADELTTFFASDNENEGIMFDVNVLSNDISIESFDLNLETGGIFDIAFYYRTGSHVGFENDPSAWTLAETLAVNSAGTDSPSLFDIQDIVFDANTTYAFYFTNTLDDDIRYTDGSGTGTIVVSNGDLEIFEGVGVDNNSGGGFGQVNQSRIWNGTVRYSAVPEPSTAIPLVLAFASFCSRGRGRKS